MNSIIPRININIKNNDKILEVIKILETIQVVYLTKELNVHATIEDSNIYDGIEEYQEDNDELDSYIIYPNKKVDVVSLSSEDSTNVFMFKSLLNVYLEPNIFIALSSTPKESDDKNEE